MLSKPIARDLEKGNWSFAQLREKPTTVYIILPPQEIKDKRRWIRLLFTCALCEHLKPGPVGTLFILDEFRVAVGHLEIINNFWSLVRGFGVQFLVVCQSALQLKVLFKEEWEIYAGQAGAVVATLGPPGDMMTAEWMSRRAGTRMETRTSQNEGQGVNTQGVSIEQRRNRVANRNRLQVAAGIDVDPRRNGPHLDAGPGQYLDPVLCPELLETAARQAVDRSKPLLSRRSMRLPRAAAPAPCHAGRAGAAAECCSSPRGNGGAVRRGGVAVALSIGVAWHKHAEPHACLRRPMFHHWRIGRVHAPALAVERIVVRQLRRAVRGGGSGNRRHSCRLAIAARRR